jgi:transposase InsO family protein
MPWKETNTLEEKISFVVRAGSEGGEYMIKLCQEYGISRPTGYLWLKRYRETGSILGLWELSRRPHRIPRQTSPEIEKLVLEIRGEYGRGAKKIKKRLDGEGLSLSVATINRIIKRHGLIETEDSHKPALKRFERKAPNQLWQMDFKGEFKIRGGYCYPLTLLDDHSRYSLGIFALPNMRADSVWPCLKRTFEMYGVPEAMLMDHGTPWWSTTNGHGLTHLTVRLIKQGIKLYLSGIRHPQTQGKLERFHRTLKHDILYRCRPETMAEWREAFANFIEDYNRRRPHESLGMEVPESRYAPSRVAFQSNPPEWEYPQGADVRRLNSQGMVEYCGRRYFVCEALGREFVQLQVIDKLLLIKYRHMYIREIERDTGRTKAIVAPES